MTSETGIIITHHCWEIVGSKESPLINGHLIKFILGSLLLPIFECDLIMCRLDFETLASLLLNENHQGMN